MNEDNVTSIITAETVGMDQLASFDSNAQAGPGVTLEIALKEVLRLTAEVRESFSDGFWCGYDAPASLSKSFVDKAFAERHQKPIKTQDSKGTYLSD